MSYEVTLRDKTILSLDDKNAISLKDALSSTKPPMMVEIGSTMIRFSEIVKIEKARERFIEWDRPSSGDLPSGIVNPGCRGERSIQKEINSIAKSYKDWAKKITDTKWRETTRKELRKQTTEWCDYKENQCICTPILLDEHKLNKV